MKRADVFVTHDKPSAAENRSKLWGWVMRGARGGRVTWVSESKSWSSGDSSSASKKYLCMRCMSKTDRQIQACMALTSCCTLYNVRYLHGRLGILYKRFLHRWKELHLPLLFKTDTLQTLFYMYNHGSRITILKHFIKENVKHYVQEIMEITIIIRTKD